MIHTDLNPQQQAAVRYLDGPLLVLAGAGSGKTRVITRKIAWLIREANVAGRHIAAVTFTNKAAREMKERVGELVDKREARGLKACTFHALGLAILRRDHPAAGLRPNFSIFDDQDTLTLLRDLLAEDGNSAGAAEWIRSRISDWKDNAVGPETALATAEDEETQRAAAVYGRYQRQLRACNAVDFGDLIGLPLELLQRDSEVRERWQQRIRYLLVDEYQDTNAAQYELIKTLVTPRNALTVVGDDDQSVYAWRGARPENLHHLQADFPDLHVIKLEQNYRSTGTILRAANTLIENNPHLFEKRLWSALGHGDPIRVVACRNAEHEAETVAGEILHHRFQNRTDFRDYAILYRGNYQSRVFEKALREARIPYHLSGGSSLFQVNEVRDLIAYLRLLVNPDDDRAFLRVVNRPRREIGTATLERLGRYAQERGISLFAAIFEVGLQSAVGERPRERLQRFAEWITGLGDRAARGDPIAAARDVLAESDYRNWVVAQYNEPRAAERRLNTLEELIGWFETLRDRPEGPENLADLVAHVNLVGILERDDDPDPDAVRLMTLHGAKGLEFRHVFLAGMEEGLLPHRNSLEADTLEEERRLAYVGLTRAQRTLTCTFAATRTRDRETVATEPSRFLEELPEDLLTWQGRGEERDPHESQARGRAYLENMRAMLNDS